MSANGFAKVTLIGNLGKDPEVRFANSGTPICNMRVGCTERVKGKSGDWEDQTEWVGVVCFGKTAENAGQYLAKGRQIYAEGRLQTREWTDKEGQKRYTTEVIANNVLFLGGGKGEGGAKPASTGSAQKPRDPNEPPPLYDNDIPF